MRVVAGIVALGVVPLGVVAPAHAAEPILTTTPSVCSTFEGVAHRGVRPAGVDENTIAAFDAAAAGGFSVETDVWVDGENKLWIFHDEDIARATGQPSRLIDQMPTDEVAALTYAPYGTPLLPFDDFMTWLAAHPDVPAYIEPKARVSKPYLAPDDPAISVPGTIAQAIVDAGRTDNTWITAYNEDLREGRDLHDPYPQVRLVKKIDDTSFPEPGNDVQTVADDPAGFDTVSILRPLTPEVVADFHDRGLRVQGQNSDRFRYWRPTLLSGADGQLTNNPAGVIQFCENFFTAPEITRFSPQRGGPGTRVVIAGRGFASTSDVRFARRSVRYRVVSNTKLVVRTDRRVRNRSRIRVVNDFGTVVSDTRFRRPGR